MSNKVQATSSVATAKAAAEQQSTESFDQRARRVALAIFSAEHSSATVIQVAKATALSLSDAYHSIEHLAMQNVIELDSSAESVSQFRVSTVRMRDEISLKTFTKSLETLLSTTAKAARVTRRSSATDATSTQQRVSTQRDSTAATETRSSSYRAECHDADVLTEYKSRVALCVKSHASKQRHARNMCKACYRSARLSRADFFALVDEATETQYQQVIDANASTQRAAVAKRKASAAA